MKKNSVIENPSADLQQFRKELFNLRMRRASGDNVALHRFRELRKLIAKCLTLMSKK